MIKLGNRILRKTSKYRHFTIEIKKDIDQTDLHHLIPQNSLSETCNIGELFSENNLPQHGLELFDENLGF